MPRLPLILALLAFAPGSVLAHPGHAENDLVAGLSHPFLGVDHLLAMLAVGFWAACFAGRARWLLPAAFVAFTGIGAWIGGSGAQLPYVEPMIALSVLALGLATAAALRLPVAAGVAAVAAFALFHGHAHFAEIPAGASFAAFAAGMLMATAFLHAAGFAIALHAGRLLAWLPRALGAATALAGAWLLVA